MSHGSTAMGKSKTLLSQLTLNKPANKKKLQDFLKHLPFDLPQDYCDLFQSRWQSVLAGGDRGVISGCRARNGRAAMTVPAKFWRMTRRANCWHNFRA